MPQRAGPGSRLPRVLGGAKESCTEAWGRQELGPRRDKTVQGPAKHPRASASFTSATKAAASSRCPLAAMATVTIGQPYFEALLRR
jgi:hypothetical protein